MKNKGQIWGIDLIIAIVIFSLVLFISYVYFTNISDSTSGSIDTVANDAKTISTLLLTTGEPSSWTSLDVIRIGITDGNYRIIPGKIVEFSNLDYVESKWLLNTRYDYYIHFLDSSDNVLNISNKFGIGKPGVNSTNIMEVESAEKLVQIKRLVIYNRSIARMVLFLWE